MSEPTDNGPEWLGAACDLLKERIGDEAADRLQSAPCWIAVKDRLPGHHARYLVHRMAVGPHDHTIEFAWYHPDRGWWSILLPGWWIRGIDHWMKIPDNPEPCP